MKTCDIKYYNIDQLNKLKFLKPETENKLTIQLYSSMALMKDDKIGKEINKFFAKFLPSNIKDLLKINFFLKEKYFSNIENKNKTINIIENSLSYLMNINFNSDFIMNKKNILFLSSVLFYSFDLIQNEYNKIKNEEDFNTQISKLNLIKSDIFKKYIRKEKFEFEIISLNNNKKNDNEINNNKIIKNENNPRTISISSNSSYPSSHTSELIFNGKYRFYKNDTKKYILPIELIILKIIFTKIQKITLTFDSNELSKEPIECYLIILLNVSWLFPYLFKVELKYSNEKIENEIGEFFKKKFEKITNKTNTISKSTNYTKETNNIIFKPNTEVEFENKENLNDSNYDFYNLNESSRKTSANSPSENKENLILNNKFKYNSVKQIIFENKKVFDLMILYPYFIKTWLDKVHVLIINSSEIYSREIDIYLKNQKINCLNFNFLKFVSNIEKLDQFEINLNGLNFVIFDRIISMIYNNSLLRILKLNIFPPEIYFQPSILYKLCNSLKINMKPIFDKNNFCNINKNDIDLLLINSLLEQFEQNMNLLFFALKNLSKIQELYFNFNLPSLILDNAKYITILLKFFYNLILLVFCSKEKYKIFSFISPFLLLDARTNEQIENLLNLVYEYKNNLIELTLQLRLLKIENLSFLINNNLQYLYLGNFDLYTFDNFCNIFEDKNFVNSSKLKTIKLSLQNSITKYSLVKNSIQKYYKAIMKNLKEKTLYSFIEIEIEEFNDLLCLISYDSIQTHLFEFKESQKFNNLELLNYNNIEIPYISYKFQIHRKMIKKVIDKYINKDKFERINLKIFNKVLSFLYLNKLRKNIYIKFKESN